MNNSFYISLIASLLLFITFLYFSSRAHSDESNEKYSFLNMFPSELFNSSNRNLLYPKILYIISRVFLLSTFVILSVLVYDSAFVILISGIGIINLIIEFAMFYDKVNNSKNLILVSVLFFILSICFDCIFIIYNFNLLEFDFIKRTVVISITSLLLIVKLIVMFSPKIAHWANLEKKVVDEQVVYVRPKYFVLAYSQWVFIFLNLIAHFMLIFMI